MICLVARITESSAIRTLGQIASKSQSKLTRSLLTLKSDYIETSL
jgi:hypothetical protein